MKYLYMFVIALAFSIPICSQTASKEFRVMIINYNDNGFTIPQDFLTRCNNAGYNYIMVEFPLTSNLATLQDRFEDAFELVDNAGMRMIPKFQSGSKHSGHWEAFRSTIEMNECTERVDLTTTALRQCPSFVSTSAGIDQEFEDVVSTIEGAFNNVITGYDLEFICIGHDEVRVGTDDGDSCIIAKNSNADQDWITLSGLSTEEGIKALYAQEIYRRVDAIQSVFGANAPRVLLYADPFDPEHNGSRGMFAFDGSWITLSPGNINSDDELIDFPGLTVDERELVKESIILLPWSYRTNHSGNDYNALRTFEYFAAHDLDFWPVSAYESGQLIDGDKMISEYAKATKYYSNNCNGFVGAAWAAYQLIDRWNIIEELMSINYQTEKIKNFNYLMGEF